MTPLTDISRPSLLNRLSDKLFQPIDIAPLVFFRVVFGGIMLWEVWRYFYYNRIYRYYIEPTFFFHYYGFDWVRPLPGDGMYILFYFMGLLSILILVGAFYRLSMILFWVCFSYVFLLDQAQYLNHFYLISLVSFLMIFIPAHRAFSVDSWLRPSIRAQIVPAWTLGLLCGQMALVYIFGGIAKINPDWLAGEPLRAWLANRTDFPLIGHLFTQEWMVYLFSYGGLLLDLFVVPLLLWRATRIPALILAAAFHITNSQLFNIGVFPWFALAATLLFLPPSVFRLNKNSPTEETPRHPSRKPLIVAGIALYFAVQILLPLRHWLYPGDPSWTEEGHTLAWHMRLRSKEGEIAFFASDPATGTSWQLPMRDYLTARQFNQMKDNPDMILRLAHDLPERLGNENLEIRAWSSMSLNSRAPQLLIDPTVNLVRQPDDLLAADWILPLAQKPVPHGPIPALLISRRFADVLVLVNITEIAYPLASLQIDLGEYAMTGEDFGLTTLEPAECILLHHPQADVSGVFVPCNEAGRFPLPDAPFQERILHVRVGTEPSQACDKVVCVVA